MFFTELLQTLFRCTVDKIKVLLRLFCYSNYLLARKKRFTHVHAWLNLVSNFTFLLRKRKKKCLLKIDTHNVPEME